MPGEREDRAQLAADALRSSRSGTSSSASSARERRHRIRQPTNLTYFRSPYSVGFDPNMIFMGTSDLLTAKKAALGCFASLAHRGS